MSRSGCAPVAKRRAVGASSSAEHLFKVKALLVVPESLSNETLRRSLDTLANELMLDIGLGNHPGA